VLYSGVISHPNERHPMTSTTASFRTGSEFRADWTEWTPRVSRINGVMMSNPSSRDFKSEIFSTYEQARNVLEKVRDTKNIGYAMIMVRLPGNKRFAMAFKAEKSS
jgi:hypothetical protein